MSFGSIASFQPIASYFRSTPNNRDIGDAPTLRDDTSLRTDSPDEAGQEFDHLSNA
jgi:hypothetical protein